MSITISSRYREISRRWAGTDRRADIRRSSGARGLVAVLMTAGPGYGGRLHRAASSNVDGAVLLVALGGFLRLLPLPNCGQRRRVVHIGHRTRRFVTEGARSRPPAGRRDSLALAEDGD